MHSADSDRDPGAASKQTGPRLRSSATSLRLKAWSPCHRNKPELPVPGGRAAVPRRQPSGGAKSTPPVTTSGRLVIGRQCIGGSDRYLESRRPLSDRGLRLQHQSDSDRVRWPGAELESLPLPVVAFLGAGAHAARRQRGL